MAAKSQVEANVEETEGSRPSSASARFARAALESAFGLVLACLALWALIVSVGDAEFVYQGF